MSVLFNSYSNKPVASNPRSSRIHFGNAPDGMTPLQDTDRVDTADQFSANPLAPQTTQLSNGIKTHLLWMPHRQQSAMELVLPLSPALSGVSGFLSSLLTDGSEATRQRMAALQERDIQISVDNTPEKLLISARCPIGREAEMASGVLQLLCKPSWQQADFDRLRQNTGRRIIDNANRPTAPLSTVMAQVLYGPNTPYSYKPAEKLALLQGQSLENVQSLLQQTLKANPGNLMLASPLSVQEQKVLLEKSSQTADWQRNPFEAAAMSAPSANPVSLSNLSPAPLAFGEALTTLAQEASAEPQKEITSELSPTAHSGMLLVPNENVKRARMHLLCQSPMPGDPDYPAFLVLKHILSGHTEGSYFERLRTRDGLVYGVSSGSSVPMGHKGSYETAMEVDFDKIPPSINGLLAVTQNSVNRPPSPEMLETAKRRFLLSLAENAQTAWSTLDSDEPWLLQNMSPPSEEALRQSIQRVTPDDVHHVAQKVFGSPQQVQVLGITAPAKVLKQNFPGLPLAQAV